MKYSKTIAEITIEICEKAIGEDLVLTLSGGEKPHIGCVVQAVPRPSLSGDGTISVTSSVIKSKIFFITFSSSYFSMKCTFSVFKYQFFFCLTKRFRTYICIEPEHFRKCKLIRISNCLCHRINRHICIL